MNASRATRPARIGTGVLFGTAVAAIYFLADLAGALIAVGGLFDPTLDALLLVVVAGTMTLGVGALLGAILGGLWPARLRRRLRWRLRAAAALALFVVVAVMGSLARRGRNLEAPGPRPPLSASRPAPVMWIVIDTLRADTLYGDDLAFPHAPAMGDFAGKSLIFTDAESSAGWTIPATATLFTGIHNTTMDASAGRLPDWAPTVAEHLRGAGFETRAVMDNAILEPRNGFAAGFESWFQRSGFRFAFTFPGFRLLPRRGEDFFRQALRASYYGAAGVTDEATRVLREERSAPLFLYVHYMDPHGPYYANPHVAPDPPGVESIDFCHARDRLRKATDYRPTEAQMRLLRHRYAGEVRAMDPHVGRLLAAWKKRYGDSGMILLTSDHGEEFLEHGHLSHSLTVHREITHVPLILQLPAGALPESRAARRITTPVMQVDLLPTTLDLLGISPSLNQEGPALQGQSWLAWLRGQSPAPNRPLLASHSRHGRRTYRYREGHWAYIKTMFYDERPTEEALYNLGVDPAENHNLIAQDIEGLAGIRSRFETLSDALWKSFEPKDPDQSQVDEESLRALGYIQ